MGGSNRRRWGGLAVLSLAVAIVIIDTTLINVSLQTIAKDLDANLHDLQWVITGYALVFSAFMITGGRMGDLFGRKRMFLVGAVLFAVGSLVAASAQTITQLLVGASVIEGLGAALMMPATASLLLSSFTGRERAMAFGVWGGVAGAAASIGPLMGGYLTTYFSWRWGYLANVVIVGLIMLFAWLVKEAKDDQVRPSVDYVGIGLSVLGLASIVYGIVESSAYGWFKALAPPKVFGQPVDLGGYSFVPLAIIFGLLVLGLFCVWEAFVERRGKTPLVSLKLFSNTRYVAGVVTVAIVALGQFGALFSLPVFLQAVQGLDAFHNGLALLPFSLTILLVAPLAGFIGSRKIMPKYLIVAGLIIEAAGMAYLHHSITITATASDLVLPLIVFGVGFGMAFAQLSNVTLSAVPVREAGEATGVFNTFRQIGGTMGNAVLGSILIATLTAGVASGIHSSMVVPDTLKSSVTAGSIEQAKSLGVGQPQRAGELQPAVAQELERIRKQATTDGARAALGYGVLIVMAGILTSLWLPLHTEKEQSAKKLVTKQP